MGRSYLKKHFMFSNGDILSKKIEQADPVPLDKATTCLRKLFMFLKWIKIFLSDWLKALISLKLEICIVFTTTPPETHFAKFTELK